jgi:hypothetical protein
MQKVHLRELIDRKKFLKIIAKKIAFIIDTVKKRCYNFSMLKNQHLLTG